MHASTAPKKTMTILFFKGHGGTSQNALLFPTFWHIRKGTHKRMKLRIDQKSLSDGITVVSKAVPSKNTVSAIQECILVDASTEKIRLIGNDTELGIETVIDGTIEEHGTIAIDATMLGNIVRRLPGGDVNLWTENEDVFITCGQSKFNIPGRDGTDFAVLPDVKDDYSIELSELTLRDNILKTIFSLAVNDNNQLMTGELFEIKGTTLRIVALDGHRIAIRMVELPQSYEDRSVVIPGKTLSEISKILSADPDSRVTISFSAKHGVFSFDNTRVVTRLIEGRYFQVDQMISSDYSTKIVVDRQELLSCLERASLLVSETDKKPIIFRIGDGQMELRIRSVIGKFDEMVEIEKEGNDLDIGFNPKFLIDALHAIDDDKVPIYLSSSHAPAFLRDDKTYCYLILPVNFVSID